MELFGHSLMGTKADKSAEKEVLPGEQIKRFCLAIHRKITHPVSFDTEPVEVTIPDFHVRQTKVIRHHIGSFWRQLFSCLPGISGRNRVINATAGVVPVGLKA
jgi:hypothetical protein